ncbi:MAG: InlB B-repeat-containing protein, partial [Clostridia bacterium]|nr:InlB B-repeat-containing protein [Clostridia bacterium]
MNSNQNNYNQGQQQRPTQNYRPTQQPKQAQSRQPQQAQGVNPQTQQYAQPQQRQQTYGVREQKYTQPPQQRQQYAQSGQYTQPQQYAPQQYTQEQQYQNSQADARYSNIMENLDVLHSGNLAEERARKKGRRVAGVILGLAALTAVAVPVTIIGSKAMENAEYEVQVNTEFSDTQTYSVSLKKGSTIAQLKTKLNIIPGYSLEGVYKDAAFTQAYADNEKVSASSQVYLKYEKETYILSLPTEQEQANNHYEIKYVQSVNLEKIEWGSSFVFQIVPKDGYELNANTTVTAGGQTLTGDENGYYTVSSIERNTSITISGISAKTYNFVQEGQDISSFPAGITVTKNGSVITSPTELSYGDNLKISYTVQEGYEKTKFIVNGTEYYTANEANITVTSDIEIEFEQQIKTYSVNMPESLAGKYNVQIVSVVDKDGEPIANFNGIVPHGGRIHFKVEMEEGYKIPTITLNNKNVGIEYDEEEGEYIATITTSSAIQVQGIAVQTYDIIFKDDEGNTISSQTVEHGKSAITNINYAKAPTVSTQYEFLGWKLVDASGSDISGGEYVTDFTQIKASMILQAVYKESVREYELNYRLGDGCSSMLIRVNGEEATSIYTIKYGDKITVEANPNIADGYTSTEIKINDNDYDGEYSVEENVYIVATGVKEGKCGISLVQGNGYKISLVGSSDTSVDAGTTVKIKVETLDAYEETKDFLVKNNGTIIGTSAGEYEVTINQNTEITVEGVELKEFTLGTIPNNVKVKRTKTDKEGASIDTYLSSGETIYYGDILSISAEVTEGYKEPIITINGNAYTQPIEVKSNISVGYQETLITQTIKLVGGAGYSFAPQWAEEDVVTDVDGVTTVSNVPIIKDFYFTLILAEGYSLNNSNISVEGATITEVAVNQYKVSGFTTDLNITLPSDMVKVNQYKVISPVSNAYTFDFGSLDDNGNDWLVNYGDDVEFTFTFNEDGYKMAEGSEVSLSVTGATLEHDEETGKYTLKDVNGTVFIVVNGNIEINKYSVTLPETQTGYTLTADKDSVKYKDSVTFTLELNAEYSNSNFSLVIDGVTYTKSQFTPISSTNIYTLTIDEVTKNLQSINVEGLVQNSYTITLPSTQTGYTLTADTSVVHGGSAIITITLDDKYSNSDFSVKIGGSTYSKSAFEFDNNKYTLELINITSNLSIELAGELTANTYSITLPQTQTGYQLSANKSTVTHGEGLIVEFNLLEGYTQSENLAISVISKGKTLTTITKSMLTDGAISYTLPEAVEGVGGVIADVEIAVTGVELNTYDVDVNYGKGIKSATLSKDSVIHDGNTTLTIVLEENYLEDKDNLIVKIGNSEIPLSGLTALNNTVYTYTLQKVQDHTTIEIGDLSENTYDVTLPSTTLETEGYTLIANKTAGVKHGEEITLTLILADTHATANFVVKIGHDEYDRTDFIQNAENNNIYTKTITITNDITASVTLDLTYTVTFKSADGTSTLSTQKIEHNQYAVEPKAPTKARDDENNIEYEFVGWSTTLGGDVVEDIDSTSVTENVTYFAKFIEVYTVTFMNGNEVFATQKVRNGDTITSISAPTKADESGVRYAFDYWQDEAGNDATSAVAQAVSANATYTAQFIESEYLVSFVHNGTTYATQWVESGEVIDEDALTLSSTPSKSSDSIYNYIHDGWSATDDGSLIDLSTQIINDVTTYYAHFDEEYIEYDITTNTSETGLEIVVYDSNSDEEVTSVHYGHNYYFTCSGGDAYTTYVNGSQVSANAEFTAYGNIIIQAIENAKEVHLVQFVDEADNILASQAVVEGQAPTAPSEPTKPSDNTYNYTFSHWQASDGSEVTDWSTQTIIGDTDYTAVFDAEYIEYDIDIKKPDGVEFDMSIFDSNNDYVGTVRYGNKYHIVFVNYPTKDCVFYLNGEEIKEDDEFTAYGDIIIQAIEVAETHHTVTFRYNDENGEAKTITQSVLEGDVVVAPYVIDNYNTIDTKYTFIGWSVTPNDTENAVKDLNSTIDRDGIVYYGVYIESQYLVTFENNGEIVATQWVDADGYATVPSQTLKAPT